VTTGTLDGRMRLSIELALTAANPDPHQDAAARALGMTGAEIDAARRGWSFDVRTSLALALAIACENTRRDRRARALKAGIPEAVCHEIEALARQATAGKAPRHV
jgi:hypothetical protein